jgi:ATP/maltotriose-dependent transcriptional regulator MalT
MGCKLTLVSAPAGFGKTTLIAEWLSQSTSHSSPPEVVRSSWLSLDKYDDDPNRFWQYLFASLESVKELVWNSLNLLSVSYFVISTRHCSWGLQTPICSPS